MIKENYIRDTSDLVGRKFGLEKERKKQKRRFKELKHQLLYARRKD